MKKKVFNAEHIEGKVYEHNLALKKVENQKSENFGTPFINGTLDVVTDEAGLNVVQINFTYVTEFTKKGTRNDTFTALKTIIDSGKTVSLDGFANATMVKIDTALDLNDWYTNKDGEETLVSTKKNEGGFVHIVTKLGEESIRNTFEVDMLINGTRLVEANPEKHIDKDYLIVKGAVFNFKNALLPVELIVKNEGGIRYFESLEASSKNLVFTKVWGKIECQTVVTRKETESAFGEASVKEFTNTIKQWVITGAAKETYPVGDEENGITAEEIEKAMQDREVYLAEKKRKQDEYQASKNSGSDLPFSAPKSATTSQSFNF